MTIEEIVKKRDYFKETTWFRVTRVIRTCLKANLFKSFLRFVLERRQPICVLNAKNPIKIFRF